MNCDWTKEYVVLFIYGELADDAKFEFEQHLRHCLGCRRELDAALEFKDGMAAHPMKEVSPSFLAANRMQLQESLEHAEQARNIFSRFIFDAAGWFHQIKLAPALTAALLMIGFAGGVGTTYKMMDAKRPPIIDNTVVSSHRSQRSRNRFHHPGSKLQPGFHQIQHIAAADAERSRGRSAHTAAAGAGGPQQPELRPGAGFH